MLVVTGCFAGAGPVVGVGGRGHHVTVGWEATVSGGPIGVEAGQAFALGARATTYGALRAFLPLSRKPPRTLDDVHHFYLGGSLGFGQSEGEGGGVASVSPMFAIGAGCTTHVRPVFTVQLGVRFLASGAEAFVAPKLGAFRWDCGP